MKAPKAIRENELFMSEELKAEKLKVMRNYLWNEKITDEAANAAIDIFNKKWILAGGIGAITKR